MAGSEARAGDEVTWRRACAAAAAIALGSAAAPASAGTKPDRKTIENSFHVLWPALRDTELMSRAAGNTLYAEHVRDIRMLKGILRYTQSVPLSLYDLRSSYDSVTEIYTRDFADARDAFASPANRQGADAWVARLAGRHGAGMKPWRPPFSGMIVLQDHVMLDGFEQGYRWFSFMRRKDGVSARQAQDYLRKTYAPALARLPGVSRYVLGLTYRPDGADEAGGVWAATQKWDAVDMIWFATLDDMKVFFNLIDYQENILRSAEAAVIDESKTVSFATHYAERLPFPPRYDGPGWEETRPAAAVTAK